MIGIIDKGGRDELLKEYIDLLYNQALLLEGAKLKDPAAFAKSVAKLMLDNVNPSTINPPAPTGGNAS